jgi:hypothetical protein
MKMKEPKRWREPKSQGAQEQDQFIFIALRFVITIELHGTFYQDVVLSGT